MSVEENRFCLAVCFQRRLFDRSWVAFAFDLPFTHLLFLIDELLLIRSEPSASHRQYRTLGGGMLEEETRDR